MRYLGSIGFIAGLAALLFSASAFAQSEVRIATFNIQNFGKTKAGKPAILNYLAEVIREFDLVAVQEISDVSETAPKKFLEAINATGRNYGLLLSERTGKQPNDKTSQEQYAFYYDTNRVEALDKGAKLLGLGYPGGPLIERFATGGRSDAFDFPRGNGPRGDLSFSFSGLKTSLRYRLEKMSVDEVTAGLPDLCASYQQVVIDSLLRRTRAALSLRPWRSLGLSGGVANNGALRRAMSAEADKAGLEFLAAAPRHTGDNAGMIGFAAWSDVDGTQRAAGYDLSVEPNAPLA